MTNHTSNYIPEIDPLALGLTRSPLFMGVNIRLFFANIMLGALICVDAHTFLGIPLSLFLHLILVKFSINEPNFLYIWVKALSSTPPLLNRGFWGGTNSYEPW
jgi:type IV secretory pathway VirB3-like protein